jgi:Domain of unknown function (DU1801)
MATSRKKGSSATANKTVATGASVADFLGALPEARRADAQALARLMRAATGEAPKLWGPSIVGFGSLHYRYESGREGDTPLLGFAPRKAALVVYGATGFPGAEALLARLGRHTTGKGCLYLKAMADLDPAVLRELLTRAAAARAAAQA